MNNVISITRNVSTCVVATCDQADTSTGFCAEHKAAWENGTLSVLEIGSAS